MDPLKIDSSVKDMERREFVRIRIAIPVRYAFLDVSGNRLPPGVSEASCVNLSAGGLLLQAKIPDFAWIAGLLTQKMAVAVSIPLPTEVEPVKGITRAAWIETVDADTHRCNLGLKFKEVAREDQDRIFRFVVKSQLG